MDKSKEYKLFYDEDTCAWVCTSNDFQIEGICSEFGMEEIDLSLAPLLAVADAMELDKGILFDELKEGDYSNED